MPPVQTLPNQQDTLGLIQLLQELTGSPVTGQAFFYPITTVLAASATNIAIQTTINQNPFLWMAIVEASATSPLYNLQFRDQQRQLDFQPAAILSQGIVGSVTNPNYLFQPYLFEIQSQIQTTFNELSGAQNTVNLVLWGINPDQRSLQLLRQFGLYSAQAQ